MPSRLSGLLLLPLVALAQSKQPVTPAIAASPPSSAGPQSIVWAPAGTRFLYRQGTTIRLYDVASKSERDLFNLRDLDAAAVPVRQPEQFQWENRRVAEQPLQWSPNGRFVLVKRSGDLFYYNVDDGNFRQLTHSREDEQDPKLSPDGDTVAFLRNHDLYALDISSRKERRLTTGGTELLRNGEPDWVYPEELELGSAYWWSPDSDRIAYLQFNLADILVVPHADLRNVRPISEPQRYPQAGTPNPKVRLGIVSAKGGSTRWIDAADGTALLARVDWLPDSGRVAIQILDRIQDHLSLIFADAKNGKTRTIFEESDSAWINVRDDYRFLEKTSRILWGSERDGYRHFYLYGADGEAPRHITSGDWEVTDLACVDEPNHLIYYVSTEASPLERQLYRISFDGTNKQRLTTESGTHSISMAPGCSYYIDTHSSLAEPPRRTIHSSDGAQIALFRERDNSIPAQYEILPTELVHFPAADGTRLDARLIKPAAFDPAKKYPAIVMVYGGPHAQSVRDSWQGPDWDQALAQLGFVIWQVDNRGSAGRGHVFEKPLFRRFGKQELADQLDGVRYLISLGFVDPDRLGIYGWSYGGYMTLYSLVNSPHTFRAGIAGAPVTDWREYDTIYTERYLGLPAENEEGYRLSSPVNQAERIQSKLLLIHNIEDDNVLFQHTLRMIDALQAAGKQYEFLLYPQQGHSVSGPARTHLLQAMTAFFERNLKPE